MEKFLHFAFAALLLSGCTHRYYMPNSMQIPNLHKANDAVLNVGACNLKGWEAQGLYSPIKNGYILFNHMQIPSNGVASGNGALTEFGVGGYYWNDEVWCLSISGGFGKGRVQNTYIVDSLTGTDFFSINWVYDTLQSSMRFRRWFVQPSLLFEHKWFFAGAALRFVWLNGNIRNVDPRLSQKLPKEDFAMQSIVTDSPLKFAEFGFSMGFKMRLLRLSYNLSKIGLDQNKVQRLHLLQKNQSIMLSLNIHELWRKK